MIKQTLSYFFLHSKCVNDQINHIRIRTIHKSFLQTKTWREALEFVIYISCYPNYEPFVLRRTLEDLCLYSLLIPPFPLLFIQWRRNEESNKKQYKSNSIENENWKQKNQKQIRFLFTRAFSFFSSSISFLYKLLCIRVSFRVVGWSPKWVFWLGFMAIV